MRVTGAEQPVVAKKSVKADGARRATVDSTADGDAGGPLVSGQRWTSSRKREVVIRMFRGESLDRLSREFGVEIYRLEEWRDRVLSKRCV